MKKSFLFGVVAGALGTTYLVHKSKWKEFSKRVFH